MTAIINAAKDLLFTPYDLDDKRITNILNNIATKNIDDADLYFQYIASESWMLEDSKVKSGSYSVDKGVGIRAISAEKTGYAYSDDISLKSLERASFAAKSIAIQNSQNNNIKILTQDNIIVPQYQAINPITSMTHDEKIKLLLKIDEVARTMDKRVKVVKAGLNTVYETVLIFDLSGKISADIRPLVSLQISVIVEENNRRESGRAGGGARVDCQWFLQEDRALNFVKAAVNEALINLEAKAAPAGTMPVVLGPGWPGILLHEAVGHGLEGDFNRKGSSVFAGRIGQQVAAKGVTVIDDGTIANRRGSLSVDDEGTPTKRTVLIEDGILVNYMQDKLNARLMNMSSTGNCRRESYAHMPMPRMTNTFMLGGVYNPKEIIQSVKKGLYALNFSGGQVDITSGQFVFSTSEAYLIEDGKITTPVKGAMLIGNGPEVMSKISMIGNDLTLDSGVGACGKNGQSVPVGVGQPTLKIDSLTVGGTQ